MSTIKSSNEHLTINADGSSKDIKFQANGVEKASISSAGAFTSTTIDATKLTGTIPNFTSTGIDDNADATAMTITSDEKIGIGTASPAGALQVVGATTLNNAALHVKGTKSTTNDLIPSFTVESATTGTAANGVGTSMAFFGSMSGQDNIQLGEIGFHNNNVSGAHGDFVVKTRPNGAVVERMRIRSNGKVNIGGTDVVAHLNVERKDAGAVLGVWNSHSDGVLMQVFSPAGSNRGGISLSGSTTTYATSSDYRLKENVDYTWDATTRLKQLKPARFNFIEDDTNTLVDGFIAHEVSSVVPEAIVGTKDAMAEETFYTEDDVETQGESPTKEIGDVKTYSSTKINPQGIDQSKLVPLLVKTIQELEARITALEA